MGPQARSALPSPRAPADTSCCCQICGSPLSPRRIARLDNGVSVLDCRQCRVRRLDPLPDAATLRDYYARYYLTRDDPRREEALIAAHRPILELLLARAPRRRPLTVLDYGFGNGAFLKCAARTGQHAHGADLSRQNCVQLRHYRRTRREPIQVLDLGRDGWRRWLSKRFDLITLFQIIEHVPAPLELVRQLSRLQEQGGLIYLECPNNDALYLKLKNRMRRPGRRGRYFDSLKYPEHLWGFNADSLSVLLERSNYTLLEVGRYHYADGLRQVESAYWWPPLWSRRAWSGPAALAGALVQLTDLAAARLADAGAGLYALATRH